MLCIGADLSCDKSYLSETFTVGIDVRQICA